MAQTLLFRNARLIDGLTDQPRASVSILVSGERILAVEQDDLTPPSGAQVIDLTGKTVVPGLIDTHVHATLMGDEGLPLFLAAGVTSARTVYCGGVAYDPQALLAQAPKSEVMQEG